MEAVGKGNEVAVATEQQLRAVFLRERDGAQRVIDRAGVGPTEQSAKVREKRINNVLAVLSKVLRYALDVELITKAPKVGLYRVERPEIEPWDFEQYPRILGAATAEGPDWYAAACLAGESGLRSGEVKALRWREDVDLIARTITVKQQTCYGITTTPKGAHAAHDPDDEHAGAGAASARGGARGLRGSQPRRFAED